MDWLQALILALIQGLTEFLPVSSSAHLILLPELLGWPDQGLTFDVAVHLGTLLAVLAYFRRTVARLIADWGQSLARRQPVGESGLAWYVIIATIPVVLAGLVLGDLAESCLRGALVIAATTVGFGLVLWWADRYTGGVREEGQIGLRDALVIGGAQVLAIVPGTSRSGITITAGLMLGMTPSAAARFSFLLSMPTIALAGAWRGLELAQNPEAVDLGLLALGMVVSAAAAYLCIGAFLALLARVGLGPFIAYRLVLGALLLVIFL
jgi:undecaprenyl-diphosphatase